MSLNSLKRKPRRREELSVFNEELDVPFNPQDFLPDVPSHARMQATSPDALADLSVKRAAASTLGMESNTNPGQEVSLKPRTKLGQTSDKVRTDLGQTSDKVRTNESISSGVHQETSDKLRPQPRTELRTDLGQTSDKVRTIGGFFELVGLQRQIILFLHEQSKLARDRVTDPLAITVLAESCGTTVLAAQKTIQRLEGKGMIRRVSFRNGRGGWTRYEVAQEVFQEVLHLESQDKLRTNLGQTSDKLRPQPRTQLRTTVSSSSSYIDLENLRTTTSEIELFEDSRISLSPEWSSVDFSPLAEIGFTQNHLVQLAKQVKLSVAEVETSIEFFAFDLRRNGKGKSLHGSPLNFFMGILRKGIPYAPPENFETAADEARRRTREILERKDRERQTETARLKDLEFAEWRRGLTESEAMDLVPEPMKDISRAREPALRNHFDDQVWPEIEASRMGFSEIERQQIRTEIAQSLGEVQS